MAYDHTCKYIAEHFSADLATWLLGEPIQLTKLEPSELTVDPIRADTLIFLESASLILQIEFQTEPKPDIPFRMLDYRVRGYRRFPTKEMKQIVIYLHKSESPLVYQTQFHLPTTNHEFKIVRLWEQPSDIFLASPGLLPFAALTQTPNPESTLIEVACRLEQIDNSQIKADIAASTAILSGLVLEKDLIQRILRQDIMRESVIYQEILAEGEARGEARGKAEGEAKGEAKGKLSALLEVATKMLAQGMTPEQIMALTGLTPDQIQAIESKLT